MQTNTGQYNPPPPPTGLSGKLIKYAISCENSFDQRIISCFETHWKNY